MAHFEGDDNDNQIPRPGQSNAGDDTMDGNGGDDLLDGGAGNDFLVGGAGGDTLIGGAGIDTISYWDADGAGVVVNLTTMQASGAGSEADGDVISGFENIEGSNAADSLTGSAVANKIEGGGGDDRLYGMDGNDTIYGDTGNDVIYGGAGDDYLEDLDQDNQLYGGDGNDRIVTGTGSNTLDGGGGNDVLDADPGTFNENAVNVLRGGAGADRIIGSFAEHDTATYSEGTVGVSVSLTTGAGSGGNAQGDVLSGIEHLTGSSGSDRLTGNTEANALAGGNGNDVLSGMDGADRLDGGAGTDTLRGDFGTDTLLGGTGADNLDGGFSNDSLFGGDGNDILRGGAGADRLEGGLNVDTVAYSESNVGVTVNLATGRGSGGNAQGDVYAGVENANGSTGADTIIGNAGGNALRGMAGADRLTGGGGADHFVFGAAGESTVTARDTITDFSHAQGDRINLALIDANTTAAGNQAFKFIGVQAFHGVAGELRATVVNGVTYVDGDVNGDKVIDLHIALTNHPALVAGDFVL
ncbi:calcium-binding protein [Inquilinus sp. NPDC058860]|uniref:calcium-binding protein n=1 Tax=Inquilinus sp. NPDC058860 TaxID=3346652 RepID=UPI0036AB3B0F